MTNIKAFVPDYEDIIKWDDDRIIKRYKNVEILIGNSDSIKHIHKILDKHFKSKL